MRSHVWGDIVLEVELRGTMCAEAQVPKVGDLVGWGC